ncbi:MAG: hypothetical protein KC731_33820 [Myxococcales bacterium]|nr:hypothetical protein [Myxococcales bacterium]
MIPLESRPLSSAEAARARFGGEALDSLGARSGAFDGLDIGPIANPVELDGEPAWAVWSLGGIDVYRASVPLASYTEFLFTHRSPFRERLQKLHAYVERPIRSEATAALMNAAIRAAAEGEGSGLFDDWMEMTTRWWRQGEVQRRLRPDMSFEERVFLLLAIREETPSEEARTEALVELAALAAG